MENKYNVKNIINFMGACIAFAIGAGFATGQEVMQFFAAYGYQCILTGLVFLVIMVYTNISYANAGHKEGFEKGSDVFVYDCGPVLGKVFDYFTVLFCYMSFVVMVSGAASTLSQQFGFPNVLGGTVIAILAGATVMLGLNSLVGIIGKIGPVMIIFTLLIAIITLIQTGGNISTGIELMESGQVEVMSAGSNWFTAGIAYGGFALLWFAGFVAKLGANNNIKEVRLGVSLGQLVTIVTGIACAFALMANIELVSQAQIPNLALTTRLAPWVSIIFAIVVFAAIYSSATPLLWTAVSRFATEKTKQYNILAVALTIIGCIVAFLVPFNVLINYIYVINGYAGFVLVLFMVIKDIKVYALKK